MKSIFSFLESLEPRIAPATIIVNTASDDPMDPKTTLREAIDLANSTAKADTIVFDKTIFKDGIKISLNSALPTIDESLVIKGPGIDKLTIDGVGQYSIFTIKNDNKVISVSISNLGITGGKADVGGGINSSEKLSINHVAVYNNHSNFFGGGIVSTGPSLAITNSFITENAASNGLGGGLALVFLAPGGKASISNTTFIGNTTDHGPGGGIYLHVNGGVVSLKGVTASNNSATNANGDGGGIYMNVDGNGSKVIMKNSNLTGNTASGDGGGLAIIQNNGFTGLRLSLSGISLLNNSAADHGGGISLDLGGTKGVVMLNKGIIKGNDTTSNISNGGGIYITGADTIFKIKGFEFIGNSTVQYGGGLAAENGTILTVVKSTFQSNETTGVGSTGGGLYFNGTALTIWGSNFLNNKAESTAGGAGIIATDKLSIGTSKFIGNTAQIAGGAYLISNNTAHLAHLMVTDNIATLDNGGGLVLVGSGTFQLSQSKFCNNYASNHGGGIYIAGASLVGKKVSFVKNSAVQYGGGLAAETGANVTLTKSIFQNNEATDMNTSIGGGLSFNGKALTLSTCSFLKNKASVVGGLAASGTDKISIAATKFLENTAHSIGGIFLISDNVVDLTKLTVANNISAGDAAGGIALQGNGTFTLSKSKVYNNYASLQGGGIYADVMGSLNLTKSKIYGNFGGDLGGGIYNANMKPIILNKTSIFANTAAMGGPNTQGAFA